MSSRIGNGTLVMVAGVRRLRSTRQGRIPACRQTGIAREGVKAMLYWALVFFIIAIVAAVFGFGGIAAGAESIAKVLFFLFLVVFAASLILGLRGRGRRA
jgi:uncharacterized membrane protein YtjA (UPF0391 family)